MSDPNNAVVVHQRRVWLNQIIVDLLKENPEGINKLYFWNIVAKKAKSLGPCSNYGVKNMNSLLHAFNVEEVKINNVTFVKLKSGSSSNEMLSSKTNRLKEVVCGVLQSNGGQVKRSLLWSMVAQKQGRAIVASDYGVSNIYEILTLMSDALSEIKIGKDLYVKLNKMPTHIRFLDEEVSEISSEEFPTLAESITPTPKAPTTKEINNTLKEILVYYPDGVDQDKIWNLYKDKTGNLPRPEDYKLQKRSDFFNLPDFQSIRQFPKNGKTWITIESWNDVSQQRSNANVPSTVIGAPLIAWGGPAGSLPQVNPQGNFLDYLWANMQQTGSVMKQLPVPLFSKESEDSLRQKQKPILPHTPVSQAQKGTDDSLYLSKDPILPVSAKSKNIVVNPINLPRGMKPTKDHLNDIAKECIEIISDAQECVTNEKIQELLLQRLGRTRLHDIGLRDIEQLDCIYEHNRLLCKVNAFTQAFVKVRSICTLQELEQCLCDYVIQGKKFDTLKLGPLHRLPVVFDMFKFPLDEDEFPNICTLDVMQKIRDFLTDFQKWTEKLQMEEIMNYLIKAYDVSTPYHLGIRIRSLPLVVGVLKRAQSDAARNRRSIYDSFKKELESELKNAFGNFRHHILSTKTPQQNTLKLHYLKLNVETVVAEIFEKLTCLMNIEEPPNQKEREKKTRRLRCFEAFVKMLKEDSLAQMLFHVAVCVSNNDLQDAAMEILAPSSPQPSTTDVVITTKPPPAKEEILKNLRKYLGERLNQGSLNLIHLDKIEGKLLEDFQFQTFSEMGYGRFIKFILGDPTTKRMLDESGVTLGSSPGNLADSLYQPQISDVLSFVQQCLSSGAEQHQLIENALCHQFAVKDVKKLGFGTTQRLVANSERRVKSHNTNVLYETALCAKERSFSQSQGKVGILGHQTKEAALAILHNCPLLEDMSAWSHWPSVFEPQFGKLKDFVNKYGGEKNIPLEGGNKTIHVDILAMETEPGKYLKLVSQTSIEHFTSASMSGDMLRTCGHLASIVAHNKGLHNAPLALLANHMKTTLFSLQGMDITDSPYAGKPAKFVLDCLVRLPLQISISLANQIFLEPLGQVLGQTKSKSEILNCCSSISDSNRLEELGYYLGISDWSDSLIKLKSTFLENQIETIAELESEDEFIEDNEIEEETSDDEEESASLSDEEDKEFVDATEEVKTEQVTSVAEKMVCDDEEETIVADIKEKELEEEEEKQTEDTTENVVTADKEAETVDTEPKEEINQHKELINLICSEEFGIGIQLNEDGEKLMRRQQERLGRSLDRLSKDLYSKDSHFVLELVQNADDNSYPEEFNLKDSKQRPSVNFSIDATSVTVLNNECGFKEKDIRALCDVGKSTKGKHKFGYIGQKGIGFKSVFRVTDTPQIHSNDYHICFDVNSGPMGYIQPHWIEDYEEIEEGWVTKIVLPLKESLQKSKSLAASFNDIHPSLLLFLHRLKEISINNKVENSQTRMCRYDLDNNVVEIHYDTTVNQWLVLKKLLDASNISSQVKSGVEVESTEIALAFPLKNCNVMQTHLLPPKQPVFAFLPLRSYGFRFIIQGDFDLPSSREDVDKDSPWNQWLRNEIPTLFLESIEQFKTHPSFKSVIHAVATYLQFIPGEDEVLDFFRPVAAQILKKLRSKPCIPTQPLNKDGNVLWKIPSQTVIVPDALMREVAPPEMLQKLLNVYYIHNDMANLLNSSLVHSLGIEKLTSDHLLKIGEAIATSWINVTSVKADHLLLISKWLACVYRSLDDFEGNEEILAKVCNIKIIPMSNGKLITLKDASVFLPLKTEESRKKKTKDPYLELWKDLNSIHPDLMCTEDAEINSQVHKIVLQLGVKELFANNIICHHILPILTGDEWKTKSEALLVNYVCYIKEQSEKNPHIVNFDEFVSVIQLKTNHGMKKPCETSIHFTPAYGNSIDLQRDLSGYDWILLDNCYVKDISQHSMILSWHEFFSKLGVTNFLAVEKVSVLIDPQNCMECPWSPFYPTWPVSSDGTYHIKDYACSEFTSLVKHNKNLGTYMQQMQKLCELLDRDWNSKYCKYTMTNVYSEDGQHALRETPTSFAIDLQQLPWLPARQTILTVNSGDVTTDTKFSHQKPNSVYCNSKKLESLLGHAAFYLNCTLSTSSSFSSFLQIKSVITVDVIVDLLTKWSNRPDEANKTPTEFCTSMLHIKTVYKYLNEELNNKSLQDLFHTKPVIFVPNNTMHAKNSNANVVGKMYRREELWWEDSTGLFRQFHMKLAEYQMSTSNKREIVDVYADMESFFQTAVRVLKFPQLYEYGELIQVLTLSLPDDAFKHVLRLFELIGEKLFLVSISKDLTLITVNEQNKKKLITQIRDEAIFPTKQGTWVSLSENPIIADDKELEKLFAHEPINFVRFTTETNNKKINRKISRQDQDKEKHILEFLNLFNVAKLSESYTHEAITEHYKPFLELQDYMNKIVPILQRFLCAQFADIYNNWKELKLHDQLLNWKFAKVGKLDVIYSLKQDPDIRVIRKEPCLIENDEFKVREDAASSEQDIDRYIAQFFSLGNPECIKNLKLFLNELKYIMKNRNQKDIEEQLADQDVYPLPPDEPVWFVPEPIWPVFEPTPLPPVTKTVAKSTSVTVENKTEKSDKDEALRAWPPRASSFATANAPSQSTTEKVMTMWPAPQGPSYKEQVHGHTKFTLASSEDVSTNQQPSSGNRELKDPVSHGTSASKKENENRGDTDDGRRQFESKDITGEPRGGVVSRRNSQVSENTKPASNVDDMGPPHTPQRIESRHSDDPNKRSEPSLSDTDAGTQSQSESPDTSEHRPNRRKRSSDGGMEPDAKRHAEPSLGKCVAWFSPNSKNPSIPLWLQSAQDLEYKELTVSSDLKIPDSIIDPESTNYNHTTGRWGENLVFNYLLQQKVRSDSYIFSVVWVNEMQESGKPFDFECQLYKTDGTNQSLYTVYIEVKSTLSDKKEAFEISGPEVQFAFEKQSNFHVYRVYNAGNAEKVRLVKIENLASQIDQKNVRLCLVI